MSPILEWGIPIIKWLQALGDWLVLPMKFFTYLGNEEFYILIAPTILWCFDVMLGLRIGLLLLTSGSINNILKLSFGFPRPYWVSRDIKAFEWRPKYGLPSGHAQNATIVWGSFAAWIRKRWVTVICVVLVLLISVSRVYLGMHFPADVLAGWLIGGLLLGLFLKLEKPLGKHLSGVKPGIQIMLALLISLTFIGIGLGVNALTADRVIPQEWRETASLAQPEGSIDPQSIDELITASGSLFGLAAGAVLLLRWGGFNAGGAWGKRAGRYFVGIIGVLALYIGLKLIFPDDSSLMDHILRYVRYTAIGFWAAYGAPRLFVRLGLA